MIVQSQFGFGVGGEVDLVINGNSTANMMLPKVNLLVVSGDVSGSINVGELGRPFTQGGIVIGDLKENGSVSVATLRGPGSGITVDEEMAGTVTVSAIVGGNFYFEFPAGIGPTGNLNFGQFVGSSNTFTLHLQQLAGKVRFIDGARWGPFSSLVVFGGVGATGRIIADADEDGVGDFEGGLLINEMDGAISGVNLLGLVEIGSGTSTGTMQMTGEFASESNFIVYGDWAGNLHADSDGVDGGDIQGNVSIHGEFTGDICAANLEPGWVWPLPAHIDIENFDCEGTICGLGPQFFPTQATTVTAEGSRYLRVNVDPPQFEQCPMALRVATNCIPWAGGYVQADGSLGTLPHHRLASQWGELHLHGGRIAPGRNFSVAAEFGNYGGFFPDAATTWLWGDTNHSGIVDSDDVLSVLNSFIFCGSPLSCAPSYSFYANDLMPCVPNGLIDVDDILAELDAFIGFPYPFGTPCENDPCGQGGSGTQTATLTLTAYPEAIHPGGTSTVTVYVTSTGPIRGYEVSLDVVGENNCTLDLDGVFVDQSDPAYLFYTLDDVKAEDESAAGRAAAALYSGGATATTTKQLAEFTFYAPPGSRGEFTVSPSLTGTLLRDADGQSVTWQAGTPAVIEVKGSCSP